MSTVFLHPTRKTYITDEGEHQGLKNEGSKRKIPIHSALTKLGILDYVKQIKDAGQKRLFPQLQRGSNNFGDSVGKWFARHLEKLGLTDPKLVMHSLRHSAIHKLEASGCPENIAECLTGHSANTVHARVYAHRDKLALSVLREGLEKLRYAKFSFGPRLW